MCLKLSRTTSSLLFATNRFYNNDVLRSSFFLPSFGIGLITNDIV